MVTASPNVEDVAKIICESADVLTCSAFTQRYVCKYVSECEGCMARARAIMALFAHQTEEVQGNSK